MLEVFVRACPLNEMRLHLAFATLLRWPAVKGVDPAVNYHLILAEGPFRERVQEFWCTRFQFEKLHRLPMRRFWTTSKQLAEDVSQGPVYVLADDDHLPVEPVKPDWIGVGLEVMERYPECGIVAASPNTRTNSGPGAVRSAGSHGLSIVETGCTGAPYFARKGALGRVPDSTIEQQDPVMCDHLRGRGWLVGQCSWFEFNHCALYLTTARDAMSVV